MTVKFTSDLFDFGPTVTLDPDAFVVVGSNGGADLGEADWIVVEPIGWRDWNDDTVTLDVIWSTASTPDETED